jgi:hypothetical protein
VPGGWQAVGAPAGHARILGFASLDSEVLVTGSIPGPDGRAPAAWLGSPRTGWKPVPLEPHSGYARQAELTAPAVDAGRVLLLGRAFGGAHGNPRPTLWAGGAGGFTEYPQGVELLGGPRGMAVTGTAAGPANFVLTGQWDHERGGPGAAVWVSPDGEHWDRLEDSALLSAPGEQTRLLDVATAGPGFVGVGEVANGARVVPVAWTSPDGRAWKRVPLPGDNASASRISCAAASCFAVGLTSRYDGSGGGEQQLTCWSGDGGSWTPASTGGPKIAPDRLTSVEGVAVTGDRLLVSVKSGGRPRLWSLGRSCGEWRELPLPDASPEIAVTTTADGVLLSTPGSEKLWLLPY